MIGFRQMCEQVCSLSFGHMGPAPDHPAIVTFRSRHHNVMATYRLKVVDLPRQKAGNGWAIHSRCPSMRNIINYSSWLYNTYASSHGCHHVPKLSLHCACHAFADWQTFCMWSFRIVIDEASKAKRRTRPHLGLLHLCFAASQDRGHQSLDTCVGRAQVCSAITRLS